jgi:hypothetical protein
MIKATDTSPIKMMIYSKPKTGKTEAVAQLEGALILDLEKGTKYVDALKVNIDSLEELRSVLDQIIKEGKPYKYGVVDTITKLEDFALNLALEIYKKTPMGQNYKGLNILHLPNGAGYQYHRDAMKIICEKIESAFERVIYLGHLKTKSINIEGKEVNANDIDLTGKVRSSMSADVDAIGYLYRKDNQNILSFKTKDEVLCGSRSKHLKNAEIILSEIVDEKLITHWDKIYLD